MTAEGSRVGDRYVVLSALGRGGMGVVWMAQDERLGRRVALKVLSLASVGDLTARARLVREARLAATLEHPNIVRTYDVGETPDGGAFLVMELVRGKTLAQRLDDAGFTLADRVAALVLVARALAHAHRAGLVHRDVKPDNIMRADDGRVVLLDLGVAKPVGAASDDGPAITATAHGAIVGTPAYLAPEQARGGAIDARADQFALGVTAYQLVTGRLPWSSTNVAGVLAEIVADTPPPPSTHTAGLPDALDAVVMRAMEKRPEARFPDMDALADALEAARALVTPSARVPSVAGVDVSAPTTPAHAAQPIPPATPAVDPVAATVSSTRTPSRPRRWPALAALALVVPIAVWAAMHAASASPLSLPDAIVGCPPLAVASAHDQDDRWLGAAAASLACEQASVLIGGHDARTRTPAELLDLPRVPSPSGDAEVWSDARARARAIDAARAHTSAWIDGEVRATDDAFAIDLVLRAADGSELARSAASAPVLPRAVGEAMRALGAAFPRVELSDDTRDLLGVRDIETASWMVQWSAVAETGSHLCDVECPHLADDPRVTDDRRRVVAYWCAARGTAPLPTPSHVAIDDTSPAALARTADAALTLDAEVDAAALLPNLVDARAHASDPRVAAALILVEISTRGVLGQSTDELALAAVTTNPRVLAAWAMLSAERYGRPDARATAEGYASWGPQQPDAWNTLGHTYRDIDDGAHAMREYLRAVRLGGDTPLFSENLARYALLHGDRDTPRALAARLSLRTGPAQRVGSQGILAALDLAEMRFAAALGRTRTTLSSIEVLGAMDWVDGGLLECGVGAARVLGRENELVREVTARFLDPEPPRVGRLGGYVLAILAPMCASATDVTLARHCLLRLRRLLGPDGVSPDSIPAIAHTILDGAEHLVEGDAERAARELHDVVAPRGAVILAREAEVRAGTPDAAARLAAIVDDPEVPVGWLHVVAARDAERRGDHARASMLARRIVSAWAGADSDVPLLDELRALAGTDERR